MPNITLDNLLSGFIGAIVLFFIQNLQKIISDLIYNHRTKWLLNNYLKRLNNDLEDYSASASFIRESMLKHSQQESATASVSYKACENIHSNILNSDRYRLYFENKADKKDIIRYYNLCSLIDLLSINTPSNFSTEYADLAMYRSSNFLKFQNSTKRIIFKLEACDLNAKEAIQLCRAILSKFS